MPASYSSSAISYDGLIAGEQPVISKKKTLVSGQNLTRGAVLGRITTGGKYTLSASAAADGSQTPLAVLAEDCDASGGDKECLVYERGDFNAAKLTFGTGHSATTTATLDALRDVNINVVTVQPK